jgi:glycosyltransferase involved in cell wall biosynthesis
MRIGFDVSQTGSLKAGCGYVADSVIRQLIELYPDDQYCLYPAFGTTYWDPNYRESITPIMSNNCAYFLANISYEEHCKFWNQPVIESEIRLGSPQIVHANNFSCPRFKQAKTVFTLYDASFVDCPEFTTEANRWICFEGTFHASLYADMVIAISQYSYHRFLELFPYFPENRIRYVYLGSRLPQAGPKQEVSELQGQEFFLCVGTLEPRKNIRGLLRSYRHYLTYSDSPKLLVLAGGKGWLEEGLADYIADLDLSQRVKVLGYVDDATLRWLYGHCMAFVYPSLYEGFGLPVLEAMSLGAPVITSNVTSLPEVGGDAVLYIQPDQAESITKAMLKVEDEGVRNTLRTAGFMQASRFSWAETAKAVRNIYQETLELPKRSSR